jgi:hypothetical protein
VFLEVDAGVLRERLNARVAHPGREWDQGAREFGMTGVDEMVAAAARQPGGTLMLRKRDFYVRQLQDWKYSVDIEDMIPRTMRLYGQLCGWTLARAHARSGDRIAIAAYLGASDTFDQAITEFAAAYADQNEEDHQALVAAASSGRIIAERVL